MIKVCPDPCCEAVFHNCNATDRHCLDCGGNIRMINEETFYAKFSDKWFQYDYQTGEYLRKQKQIVQLSIFD